MSEHDEPTTEASATEAPASEAETDETSDRVDPVRQIAELEDAWRRTAAELDNVRKRCAQDVIRGREQERAAVAASWLPVVDNLERALEHASSEPDAVLEGVQAVLAQAVGVLADLGYPRRDDHGRAFDPALHEAVSTVSEEGLVPGTVAQVVRPGYGPDGKILRPAAVVVATRAP
ncbi:MAG: GrpE protein [Aeromicrobium sp.]|jgi:molecular chaperone GrpE|uniref:nucleotide exchange factor GrpE n=1 Tax=Aeromicrobium sp. TaxID=1871063 RepID=UPI002619A271|nr:nucleotide exchange factor GrpE [Aeromicrobium sp.]MCW2787834.1 GrpE protein [Aeromicrobium sp.]MCW2826383.1 GrpE protein [Aeromicrobium sp.]